MRKFLLIAKILHVFYKNVEIYFDLPVQKYESQMFQFDKTHKLFLNIFDRMTKYVY